MIKKINENSELFIIIISALYILYKITVKPSPQYIGVFLLISCVGYLVTNNIPNSLLIAIIFCLTWELINVFNDKNKNMNKSNVFENFSEPETSEEETSEEEVLESSKDKDNDKDEEDEGDEGDEGDEDDKKKKKKKKKKEIFDEDEDEAEPYIDVGRSFVEAYKSLSPNQIEGLSFDTKELLGTQQKLIETLNTIGPTLREGKNILSTFKEYFSEDILKK